jgi:hypothetical protein
MEIVLGFWSVYNKKAGRDPFSVPCTEDDTLLEAFKGTKYLSTADLFWGFYHVKVRPDDIRKLIFAGTTTCMSATDHFWGFYYVNMRLENTQKLTFTTEKKEHEFC